MTKSAHRLLKTRVISSLGAATLLALGTLLACGNDDIPVEGGAGASNAHAGASHTAGAAGKAAVAEAGASASGETGEAGEGGSPENMGGSAHGGMSQGGSSGKGTGGGTPGAGTGGAGVTVGCGNGVVDPGEQCDDGNTKFGDSCSPTCTNTCETCEKDVCGINDDTKDVYAECFGTGYAPGVDTATDGPGASVKKNKLCQAVVECVKRTNCFTTSANQSLVGTCYCGSANAVDCDTAPLGPCKDEIAAAAESQEFNRVAQRAKAPLYAWGAAYAFLSNCDRGYCAVECQLGKVETECQKCGTLNECGVPACYANPNHDTTLSPALCSAAVDCALSTGCLAQGVASCYGAVTGSNDGVLSVPGPCAAAFTAASSGATPKQIEGVLKNGNVTGTTLDLVGSLLTCEAGACTAACVVSPSGGTGGAGGIGGAAGMSAAGGAPGGTGGISAGTGG